MHSNFGPSPNSLHVRYIILSVYLNKEPTYLLTYWLSKDSNKYFCVLPTLRHPLPWSEISRHQAGSEPWTYVQLPYIC